MVAGQVQPPRLDLANEDLVRSHVHAIWLAEALAATQDGLGRSMADVLDLDAPSDCRSAPTWPTSLADQDAANARADIGRASCWPARRPN